MHVNRKWIFFAPNNVILLYKLRWDNDTVLTNPADSPFFSGCPQTCFSLRVKSLQNNGLHSSLDTIFTCISLKRLLSRAFSCVANASDPTDHPAKVPLPSTKGPFSAGVSVVIGVSVNTEASST